MHLQSLRFIYMLTNWQKRDNMLTKTLLLSTYRKGKIYPFKLALSEKNVELANRLIALFKTSIDRNRNEIDESIRGFNIKGVNPKVIQGLGKLLYDRSEFSEHQEVDYPSLRMDVFNRSAQYWRNVSADSIEYTVHQRNIIEMLPEDIQILSEGSPHWLYGDISDNQCLRSFKDLTPENLINRFNISQVQGVLLNTQTLRLKVSTRFDASVKQVFQMLKFFRLMFSVVDYNGREIVFEIDGPSSVLENARSYGLEIASFFPAVLILNTPWEMEAMVERKGVTRDFQLLITSDNPYKTFYQPQKLWLNDKVEELVSRFNEKYSEKSLKATCENTIFPLSGNRYLLPDIRIAGETQKSEKSYYIEWMRYLSPEKIERLKQLLPELPEHYLFAIKGKRSKLAPMIAGCEERFLIYTSNLTANSLYKIIT